MSKHIDHVCNVCADLKACILRDLDAGIKRNLSDIREITIGSFKNVAKKSGIEESTVRDACTRRLNYSVEDFYSAVKAMFPEQGGPAGDQSLLNRMCSCASDDDSEAEITKRMNDIFDPQ